MPEYLTTDAPQWDRRRDWATVRKDLEALRGAGEDCGAFSVRTSAEEGDEDRADTHPETCVLFSPAAVEVPAQAGPKRPAKPRPAGDLGRLRDAIARMNAGADYHQDTDRRRRWVVEWLAAGADPAARDPKGWTPLHFAAAGSWEPETVAALVDAGGAVEARNGDDWTPLHLAARYGSPEVATALRACGAEVDARDPGGRTALHGAAWDGAPDSVARMVAALVYSGAEVDARTQNRWTPLHLAAWRGSVEAVDALREAGAEVDARHKDDWTPLHLVARYDRPEAIAAALLEAGADPELRTRDGWTALLLAAAQGGRGLVESLLAAGSDVGARNNDGSTALELAVAYRRPQDVIAALRAAGVHAAGGSRDRPTGRVERPSREKAGAVVSSASRPWSREAQWWRAEPAGVHRGSQRPARVQRPRRRWGWMGALAAVAALVVVWANMAGEGPSSPSIRDNVAPDAAAAPLTGGASAPAGVSGTTPEAEAALSLDRSARRRIQAGLSAAGFEPGPADGLFGAATRDAIRAWQTERGVPATGYLNGEEADGLFELGAGDRASERGAPATGYLNGEEADGLFELGAGDRASAGAERGAGRLTVRATPSSRIELDGADVGATGATGLLVLSEVQPGRHVVVARKEGHTEATGVVEVVDGRAEVVELALAALPGRLTVTANVAGALLRIENAGDHRLPLNGLEIPAGSRRLTASREGFGTVENDVEIRPGQLTTLELLFESVPVDELLRAALGQFAAGNYREAADGARSVLSVRPDADAGHRLLGTALYELGEFQESINPLGRAILLGQEVVLPTKHRHGGGRHSRRLL